MFERVLVATDLEDGMYRLALCLKDFHEGGVTQLGFVHAVPFGDRQMGGLPDSHDLDLGKAKDTIERYINPDLAAATISPEVIVQVGPPVEVIQRAVESFNADVLVMAPPSRSLLAEKVFGSNTMKQIQQLKIPVLIVRPQFVASMTIAELQLRCRHLFDYLLVPCDLDRSRQSLLDMLSPMLCQQAKCESVLMMSVIDTASRRYTDRDAEELCQNAERQLRELGAYLAEQVGHPLSVNYSVRKGSPVKEILAAAQDEDVTAIVTSSRNIGKIWELTVPSITGEIIRRSWHSVLFFPPAIAGGDS
ncbi:universal stress protein [Synechococcus sp. PCC 7336]|uniref:universal stress protein n=1 Tax=Synechococcus sp. PCC 7336 TaxID=195250 RepID=UPI000373A990|nr:universal stress protein [Synechococcus sp. PCC 7336]